MPMPIPENSAKQAHATIDNSSNNSEYLFILTTLIERDPHRLYQNQLSQK